MKNGAIAKHRRVEQEAAPPSVAELEERGPARAVMDIIANCLIEDKFEGEPRALLSDREQEANGEEGSARDCYRKIKEYEDK